MNRTVAIWNPASGSAPSERDLRHALGSDVNLRQTTEDDPGAGAAAEAVAAGVEIVVACGGDGTVRACLDPLAGSSTALAIVPLGTGNLLASNLGLPTGLPAASGVGRGTPRLIDIGRINGEAFAVMAGTGFDADMIGDADDGMKARFGSLAYVWSGLRNLRGRLVATTVETDGQPWFTGRSSMVLVGNFGTVSGGLTVFPDARPDDGLLDVAVVSAATRRQWLSLAWRLVRRRPPRFDLARRTQARTVVVSQQRPRSYELDGETRPATTRLTIEVEPAAITMNHKDDSNQTDDSSQRGDSQ